MSRRRVRWFSAGAASAVATMLDVRQHGADAGPVCYIDTGSEHPDNPRRTHTANDRTPPTRDQGCGRPTPKG